MHESPWQPIPSLLQVQEVHQALAPVTLSQRSRHPPFLSRKPIEWFAFLGFFFFLLYVYTMYAIWLIGRICRSSLRKGEERPSSTNSLITERTRMIKVTMIARLKVKSNALHDLIYFFSLSLF